MGLDVQVGIMFGVGLTKDILRYTDEDTKVTRYNSHTGKPYEHTTRETVIQFKVDFWDYKSGQKVGLHDFKERLETIRCDFSEEHEVSEDNLVFSEDLSYLGFCFGEYLYLDGSACMPVPPQSGPEFDKAKEFFEHYFPGIPGELLIYVDFSY